MKFSHNLLAQMREMTSKLLHNGLSGLRASPSQSAAEPPAATMRDINAPPHARAEAQVQPQDDDVLTMEAERTDESEGDAGTPPSADAHAAAASASAAAAEHAPINPATHPAEYAQDILNRMGIQVDIQGGMANLPNLQNMPSMANMPQFDLSNMDLPGFKTPFNKSPSPEIPAGAQFISGSYSNHAGSRNYKLYIPSTYHGQAMPLLVMLHGCTQNPDDFAAGTQMNQVAEERECFVVYPEQTPSANNHKCWNWFNAIDQQRGQGEPSIIAGIAQQVIEEYPVNERQVYVAGLSAGGAMAVIVGTLYPDLFAAVGVHSGLPYASAQDLPSALSAMKRGASGPKAGNGALPIIVFHGDRDTTVHPSNGEAVMEQGQHIHVAGAEPLVASGAVPNGHSYTQTTHRKADGTPVGEHWVVHGAGHAWSGGSTQGSYTDGRGPDASREMMRFFKTVSP
jgi:poly(hydroxyalkanoate) depolymerase family esterase